MWSRYILQCRACRVPLADSLRKCPCCRAPTNFEDFGVRVAESRPCPFCGKATEPGAKSCGHCGQKIVLETQWLRRLTPQSGGTAPVLSGGPARIGRPPADAALLAAAAAGDTRGIKARLDAGDELDGADEHRVNALMTAVRNGKEEAARTLIALGANVEDRDALGYTALHYAAWNGLAATCEALVAAGADPAEKGHGGHRASDLAMLQGNTTLASRLRT